MTKPAILSFIQSYLSDNNLEQAATKKALADMLSALEGIVEAPTTINTSTTLTAAHSGANILVTAAATITVPEVATEDLPDGWYVNIKRATAGAVSVDTEGTDVVEYVGGTGVEQTVAISDQYGWVTVYKDSDGVYSVIGSV